MKRFDPEDFRFDLRELAGSMGDFGTLFPLAVVGAMMAVVAFELSRFALDMAPGRATRRERFLFIATAVGAVIGNMALGFAVGLAGNRFLPGHDERLKKQKE